MSYAKAMAPVDTGNLRDNAIKGKRYNDPMRFTIHYSGMDAYYLHYLEVAEYAGGSKTKKNEHKGFIYDTYLGIINILNAHFNEGKEVNQYRVPRNEFELKKTLRHIHSIENNRKLEDTAPQVMNTFLEV
jgi:hypothetical protein